MAEPEDTEGSDSRKRDKFHRERNDAPHDVKCVNILFLYHFQD